MAVSSKKKSGDSKAPSTKKVDDYYERTILQPAARLIAEIKRREQATGKAAAG